MKRDASSAGLAVMSTAVAKVMSNRTKRSLTNMVNMLD